MNRSLSLLGFLGLGALLGYGSAQAEISTPLSQVPNVMAPAAEVPRNDPEHVFLPLREVIRRYSGRTGVQIKFSQELRDDEQVLSKLYSSQDDAWLEDFSRVEYDNQQTGKKEIILLKSRYYDASKIPDPTPPRPRNLNRRTAKPTPSQTERRETAQANPDENEGGLSREKLFKLMRFPFKGPFADEWFEDEEYRQFLAELQINSPEAFEDRRVVMKIRNEARKHFRKLRARK